MARSRSNDLERHRLRERVRSLEARLRSQAEIDALIGQIQDRQEETRVQDAAFLDTQHELELSRDRHAELYDFAPVALASLDSTGLIEAINVAGARVLGRERAEVIGFPLAAFVARPWRRILIDYLAACRRQDAPVGSVALEFDASGGRTLPIELCCKRFTPHGGAPIYFAALVDLSERRRADADRLRADADQARVEHQESVARAANEAKDRFLAVLSHELRTPLTPVMLTLDRLALLTGDEVELRKGLETIRRNLNVETHLIDDLLDLTRIERNKLHLAADVVDLHSALDHAIEMCQAEAARAGLSLEFDLADGKPFVHGDGTRLRQVFWNLLSNAIRYTPPGGVVRVRSRVFGKQIGIDVSDTGRGVALEDLERVFSAFEQVGHDPILSGLGLGLAICRGLVEAHGGKIRATSAGPGRGATFTVLLPTCAAPAHRVDGRPEVAPHRGLRILVVEDNADTAEALGVLLRMHGYVVRLAHSLVEARRVRPEGFDVLLSDLHLPDGSGLDLLRELVAEAPIHAIAMSGYGTESDVRRSRDAGFERHLVKPVSIESVIEAIERVAPVAAPGRTREILSAGAPPTPDEPRH
jgi:PAS domain S-box-containing protein